MFASPSTRRNAWAAMLTGLALAAPPMLPHAAAQTTPPTASRRPDTAQTLTKLSDPDFDTAIPPKAIASILARKDPKQLLQLASLLAKQEKKAGHPHRTVSKEKVLRLAIERAKATGDHATLATLQKLAQAGAAKRTGGSKMSAPSRGLIPFSATMPDASQPGPIQRVRPAIAAGGSRLIAPSRDIFDDIGDAVDDIGSTVSDAASTVGDAVSTVGDVAGDVVTGDFGDISSDVSKGIDNVSNDVSNVANDAGNVVDDATKVGNDIQQSGVLDDLAQVGEVAANVVTDPEGTIGGAVIGGIEGLASGGGLEGFAEGALHGAERAGPAGLLADAVNGLASGGLEGALSGLAQGAAGELGLPPELGSAAATAVSDLAEGNTSGALNAAVGGLTQAAGSELGLAPSTTSGLTTAAEDLAQGNLSGALETGAGTALQAAGVPNAGGIAGELTTIAQDLAGGNTQGALQTAESGLANAAMHQLSGTSRSLSTDSLPGRGVTAKPTARRADRIASNVKELARVEAAIGKLKETEAQIRRRLAADLLPDGECSDAPVR